MSTVSVTRPAAAPAARAGALARAVAAIQGVFYVAAGVWSRADIDSFQAVTGPKTDLWLVYTVGALVIAVGVVLLSAARSGRVTPEVALLGIGSAVALTAIDVVFVTRGVISQVYLLSPAAEVVLVLGWLAGGTFRGVRSSAG